MEKEGSQSKKCHGAMNHFNSMAAEGFIKTLKIFGSLGGSVD